MMKFLTEDDLRVEYHRFPFGTFTLKQDQRLTPGARTFLSDRKIKLIDAHTDPIQPPLHSKTPAASSPNQELASWESEAVWLALRCEMLQVAFDLGGVDLLLAQELTALERCLATRLSGGACLLPPSFKEVADAEIDRAFIIGNLSNVGMFLQTETGHILTKLYPLYLHLDRVIGQLHLAHQSKVIELLERIGQLIAYYLKRREDVSHEFTNLT